MLYNPIPHHFGAVIPFDGQTLPIQIAGVALAWNHAQNSKVKTKISVIKNKLKANVITSTSPFEKFQLFFQIKNLLVILKVID